MSAVKGLLALPRGVHEIIQSHQTLREWRSMSCVCRLLSSYTASSSKPPNLLLRRFSLAPSIHSDLVCQDWSKMVSYHKFSTILNRSFSGVTTLHLAFPPREAAGSPSLIPLVRTAFPSLRTLKLFENNYYPLTQQDLHALLAPSAEGTSFPNNLTSLSLIARMTLFSEKIGSLINGITSLTSMEVSILERVSDQDLQAIGQTFSNTRLTTLSFWAAKLILPDAMIAPKSYTHIVQIQTIESLTITGCQVNLEGVKALSSLPSLRSLTWGQHGQLDVIKATFLWSKCAKLEELRCVRLLANYDLVINECIQMRSLKRFTVIEDKGTISHGGIIYLTAVKLLEEIDFQAFSLPTTVKYSVFRELWRCPLIRSLKLKHDRKELKHLIYAVNGIPTLRHLTLKGTKTEDRLMIKTFLREGIDFFT